MNTDILQNANAADKRRALLNKLIAERGLIRATSDGGLGTGMGIPRRSDSLAKLPQSFAQQRLWFLDRLAPGNPFYTVSLAIPIAAVLDLVALTRSLDDIVARHETLRTTFYEENGEALQRVSSPRPNALERIDLRHMPPAERAAELERLTKMESSRSFDLERGPLMVTRLVTLAAADHRLLLTLHHIVCDGWSLRVLSHELLTLYTAHATGVAARLPELSIQYGDFSSWQRDQWGGPALDHQIAYWRRELSGIPELRLLPDRIRPAVPSFRGGLVPLSIAPAQARAIANMCRECEATPFVVLMAAFMALLGRLADQDEFMIGTPVASRTRPELEPLIGFFVNTLVMRADLRGNPGFRDLTSRVRHFVLDAFNHQDVPFERLVEELVPERVLGRNPLFQTIFQLFSPQDGVLGEAPPDARQRGTAKFDLRLDLWPTRDGGYSGELEFSDDVFDEATARNIANQFCNLLANLLADPGMPISRVSSMTDIDRRLLLEKINDTGRPYPDDVGIATLFMEVVQTHGAKRALSFDDGELTYSGLDQASDAMACRLAEIGVRSGDAVAVLLQRSTAMVVAWLGILKLGAAYVPLDTSQPVLRLQAMIRDARCRYVVTTGAFEPLLDGLELRAERADIHREAPRVDWPAVRGGDLAHIIFTSGTTGRPRGVGITHRGIARLTCNVDWVDFQTGDRVGQTSNPAFDATTYEVWSALLNGCTLIGIERDTLLSADALSRKLAEDGIDHLFLTTMLFTRLVNERPGMFATLRSLMTGGAKADVAAFQAVLRAGAPRRLINAYGPTETTVLGSVWIAQPFPADAVSVPIGRPVTNTSCYVLDDQLLPLPVGAPGQLYIGGPGVSPGYLDDEGATLARFIPDPWRLGCTLYATGDRVRWRHDLQLEFLGRADDQVKIRGFRVEPDEISSVLSSHPYLRDAVVIARKRGNDDHSLVAYVELKNDLDVEIARGPATGATGQLVAHWQSLYDTALYDTQNAPATFNTSGWNDTATGAPIPETDMCEQVAQTVERVLQIGAKRVLEIGCGTGLLLFRLAPHCERYVGTDMSQVAIDHVRRVAGEDPALAKVELVQCTADDFSGIAPGTFDLILLNSVVQYFPSFDYLVEVVRAACARLAPGGFLYLGDLRHQGLLSIFHADVLLRRAPDRTAIEVIRDEIDRCLDEEQELAISPAALQELCHRVPGLGAPTSALKGGWRQNELSRFRYDAVLRWQGEPTAFGRPSTLHWERDLASRLEELGGALETHLPVVRVTDIPNARVLRAARALCAIRAGEPGTAAELRTRLDDTGFSQGIEPEALALFANQRGFRIHFSWSDTSNECFDALICSGMGAAEVWAIAAESRPCGPLSEHVTRPLHGHRVRRLIPELKAYLSARLPEYMWPDHYVRLRELPVSSNGKVDKANLPLPGPLRSEMRDSFIEARNETERKLADLWSQLLDVPAPGATDHFFHDLGGHSLLATQLISRVRREFDVEMPLRVIFENPTIAQLAQAIEAEKSRAPSAAFLPDLMPDPLAGLDIEQLDEATLDEALASLSADRVP